MRKETVKPAKKLSGTITVPGDKSISHRAAILGSLTNGDVKVTGFLRSEDCMNTLAAMGKLGVIIEDNGSDGIIIHGVGLNGLRESKSELDLGNSGTGIRLLAGLVSGFSFKTKLTGDKSLQKRPMGRIIKPLSEMGAAIKGEGSGNTCPLEIEGGNLNGILYQSPIASAQVKSAMLLAGISANGITVVREPEKSRDHTERMLQYFGVNVDIDGLKVGINGREELLAKPIHVPGDISSAAFFIVAGLIVPNSEITIKGVGINPTRSELIHVLQEMGADISLSNLCNEDWEPTADIIVKSSTLRGTTISGAKIPRLIDELPIIAVAASLAEGETIVKDAKELRVKESDRIAVMSENLKKLGVVIEEKEDGWIIQGGNKLKGATVKSYTDHRIAMSMIVAGLVAEGETVIEDTEWIDTSFPGFMDILKGLQK